jgi:hypothetical protein
LGPGRFKIFPITKLKYKPPPPPAAARRPFFVFYFIVCYGTERSQDHCLEPMKLISEEEENRSCRLYKSVRKPEPELENLSKSPGIDSQPGGIDSWAP